MNLTPLAATALPHPQQREFDAVHRVRAIEPSLLRFMLKPALLAPIGEYYEDPVRQLSPALRLPCCLEGGFARMPSVLQHHSCCQAGTCETGVAASPLLVSVPLGFRSASLCRLWQSVRPKCSLQEVRRSMWPEQAAQPAFIEYLRQRFDEAQLEAIEVGGLLLPLPHY
jgi:hypothetical protein